LLRGRRLGGTGGRGEQGVQGKEEESWELHGIPPRRATYPLVSVCASSRKKQ
jgi:hypothetical protein